VKLLFGLRVYFRDIGEGMFYCQRCGGDRAYRRRAGRRWFHIFFIPVIPLDRVGEDIRCGTCRTRYRTGVLALPTSAQMQAALPAGMQAAATTMLRAGDPGSPPARRRVIGAVRRAGLDDYGDAALDEELARCLSDEDVAIPVNTLAGQLAVQGREWFLAEVVRVGLADGPLNDEERRAARMIAGHLGMTAAQAYGVISLTEEGATAE
jgi:hypothetical protein